MQGESLSSPGIERHTQYTQIASGSLCHDDVPEHLPPVSSQRGTSKSFPGCQPSHKQPSQAARNGLYACFPARGYFVVLFPA